MKKTFCLTYFLILFSIYFSKTLYADLLLFSDDDKYLGCLDCSKYNNDSICNEYGTYGSKYNSNSIWNTYGTYGNPYSSYSPWNSYTSSSPKIVDRQGNFYGRFSINIYAGFEQAPILKEFYEETDGNLDETRDFFCDAID